MTKEESRNGGVPEGGDGGPPEGSVEEEGRSQASDSPTPEESGESSPLDADEVGAGEDVPEGADDTGEGEDLEALQAELGRLRDRHLRLAADFENYRKRASAELTGNWVRARADLVRSLVEGLDDLQRVGAFTSEDTTVDALIEGVDLVERNILKALTEAGLEVLNPEGQRFDPNIMEAMMRVPTEEPGQDETVHQVFLKGYMFKDQLVRPARVSVYKDDD
ncbi:MAG: nucleotide exchange factor GrpE [Gemmatimonadetes bacterium]|nr:nucleotide exchange factor GrpE [Gemmatimonadota bacterium]NNM06994.1 nucleotide exchange factor GrpE [Gemmatimonadota bacterium]